MLVRKLTGLGTNSYFTGISDALAETDTAFYGIIHDPSAEKIWYYKVDLDAVDGSTSSAVELYRDMPWMRESVFVGTDTITVNS